MKTKIFHYIFSAFCIIALLASCAEESLDDFILANITLKLTWENDHPNYQVNIENCDIKDVKDIEIHEQVYFRFYDRGDYRRSIQLSSNNLSHNEKYWDMGKGDSLLAYASMETSQGRFRSETVSFRIAPGTQPIVKSASFKYTGESRGILTLIGSNFENGDISFASQKVPESIKVTPTKIECPDYFIENVGQVSDVLIINNEKTSFSFNVPAPQITYVSSKDIICGDTVCIQLSGFAQDSWLQFQNCVVVKEEGNTYTIVPTVNSGIADIDVYENGYYHYKTPSVSINVQNKEWEHVVSGSNNIWLENVAVSLNGNKYYAYSDGKISVYNASTGKVTKTYTWNKNEEIIDIKLCASNDYLYIAYVMSENLKQKLDRLDLSTGKLETIGSNFPDQANFMWMEGSKLRMLIGGNSYAYGYDKTNGATIGEYPSNFPGFKYQGTENGYIYGNNPYYGNDNQVIYKYQAGEMSSATKVGTLPTINKSSEHIIGIIDGWIFHTFITRGNLYIRKTRLSTLNSKKPETVCLGHFEDNNLSDSSMSTQMSTDGTYYYISYGDGGEYFHLFKQKIK